MPSGSLCSISITSVMPHCGQFTSVSRVDKKPSVYTPPPRTWRFHEASSQFTVDSSQFGGITNRLPCGGSTGRPASVRLSSHHPKPPTKPESKSASKNTGFTRRAVCLCSGIVVCRSRSRRRTSKDHAGMRHMRPYRNVPGVPAVSHSIRVGKPAHPPIRDGPWPT